MVQGRLSGGDALGNDGVGFSQGDGLAVILIDGEFLLPLGFQAAKGVAFRQLALRGRVGGAIVPAFVPEHGRPLAGVVAAAHHAQLLAVIDEGVSAHKEVHGSGQLHSANVPAAEPGDPSGIVVGEEGGVDVVRVFGPVGVIRLFLGRGKGGDGFFVVNSPEHGGDLAAAVPEGEVENAGDAAGVVVGDGAEALPHLRHQIGIGVNAPGGFRQEAQHLDVPGGLAGEILLGGIQPEAGDALFQPEGHDIADFLPERLIFQIQVGHPGPEFPLVVPVGAFHRVVIHGIRLLGEEIVVKIRAVLPGPEGITGGLEPGVVHAGVVQHQVQDHPDVPGLALGHEFLKIRHGAVLGVDGIIVRYVVLMVGRAGVNGHQPDAVYPQLLQIVQLGDHSPQIADAVAVGIAEGVHKNFVPGAVIVVGFCGHVSVRHQVSLQLHPRRIGGEDGDKEKQGGKQQTHLLCKPPHGTYPLTPPAMAS